VAAAARCCRAWEGVRGSEKVTTSRWEGGVWALLGIAGMAIEITEEKPGVLGVDRGADVGVEIRGVLRRARGGGVNEVEGEGGGEMGVVE